MNKTFTNKQGNLILEIRDQGMSAWMTIKASGKLVDENEILALIDQAGIKAGFEDALRYISQHNLEKDFDHPFPLALCNTGAATTKLRYYFDREHKPDPAKLLDSLQQSDLSYVLPGTVLADYSSNLFDRQGSIYNIFGEIIPNENVDAGMADEKAGQNVDFDPQRNAYVARRTGYPYLDRAGQISILDMITITDSTQIQSPLRTPLSVICESSISGLEILAQGSIEIRGGIENCSLSSDAGITILGNCSRSELTAKHEITVNGDIIDCHEDGLNSGGDLSCNSIVDSLILCRAVLHLNGQVTGSRIVAEKGIKGHREQSSIANSHVQSSGDIELGSLGSVDGGETDMEITISPYYKAILMNLTKEMIKAKADASNPPDKLEQLKSEIQTCEQELDYQLNTFLKRPREERIVIRVHHDLHPVANIRVEAFLHYEELSTGIGTDRKRLKRAENPCLIN